jgi:branched-chain amino acid transport system substrate-binding protein
MAIGRRRFLAYASTTTAALAMPRLARALGTPIRIGEINSYSVLAASATPYRMGWQLALDEINGKGGVLGRKLEILARDDGGKPDIAARHATELLTGEKVDLLAGSLLSHIGLAISDVAREARTVFFASHPLTDALVWEHGNRYTFRMRPSTYSLAAMMVEEAAKLPGARWATIAPNYEYGQSAVASFKTLLAAKRPEVQFIAEQWPALGRIEAGAVAQAVAAGRPDNIFNVCFGPDLVKLVREGNTVGLWEGRRVVSLLTGEPEYMDPLGDETPKDWIVTGYPWQWDGTPAHVAFRDDYQARYKDYPRFASVVGYTMVYAIAAGIARAGSTESERLVGGLEGLSFPSVFGPVDLRALDHQSTFGAFVGRTGLSNGKGVLLDARYADGRNYLPSDAEVRRRRPAGA